MKTNKNGYILALDQGTTSSRAILFNHAGHIVASSQQEFTQFYPQPGWVEHDPLEIWETQLASARNAMETAEIKPQEIVSIGITNQRETVVVWEKATGKPVYPAIVWQCRRSASICDELIAAGKEEEVRKRTGLRLDPYFSGTKLTWIFRNDKILLERAKKGEILFGTIDSWLLWKLTGRHETDVTNASRTLLFNIQEEKWDPVLLELLGIPEQILPRVLSSADDFGMTHKELFGCSIPVNGVLGDQQAALFGHTCFKEGMAKNTYGTGCFCLLNTGPKPVWSSNNLLTTIAWRIGSQTTYALEGSVFIAGAVIQWLRDELKLILSAGESESLAGSVPDANGVYLVPAFVGLGAPYWDPAARGSILGITRGVNKAHIVRASLESIAYQAEDLLSSMSADFGKPVAVLKADGGATNNRFLMQFQADISNIPVLLPQISEITALGAAYVAGLYAGFWENVQEIENKWEVKKRYEPEMNATDRDLRLRNWHTAVEATRNFRV